MLPLGLFRRRNFSAGNVETFAMYAGLAIVFFFLVLFLQQIGGYSPLKSGLATLPVTIVMFVLSRRFGRSRTASGRGSSWARGRWSRRAGCCCSSASARTSTTSPNVLPAAAGVLARAVDDGRAADRRGARGLRAARRASPRASTTRSRASRGCWARPPWARRSPPRSPPRWTATCPGTRARRRRRGGRGAGQAAAARAPGRPRRAARQAHAVSAAAEAASLHAFTWAWRSRRCSSRSAAWSG